LKMLKTMQIYQKCIFLGFYCFFAIFDFFWKIIKTWVKNWVATILMNSLCSFRGRPSWRSDTFWKHSLNQSLRARKCQNFFVRIVCVKMMLVWVTQLARFGNIRFRNMIAP
jgi:hypothetical protein